MRWRLRRGTLFVFSVVVVAIAIAVMKGIDVAQNASLPGKLRDLVANALVRSADLQPMLTDQSDLTGLFSLFIRATGPIPKPDTCDNNQLVIGGPLVVPCANRTPIPAATADDMQFQMQRLSQQSEPVGSPFRTDTLTWVDSANSRMLVDGGKYWTNQARLTDGWLVGSFTLPDGTNSGEYLTHRLTEISTMPGATEIFGGVISGPDVVAAQATGTAATSSSTPSPTSATHESGVKVDPAICLEAGTLLVDRHGAALPGTRRARRPAAADRGADRAGARRPFITVTHSANPQVGEPVTLTATRTSPDVGPLTYEWYVKPASGLFPVCGPTVPVLRVRRSVHGVRDRLHVAGQWDVPGGVGGDHRGGSRDGDPG